MQWEQQCFDQQWLMFSVKRCNYPGRSRVSRLVYIYRSIQNDICSTESWDNTGFCHSPTIGQPILGCLIDVNFSIVLVEILLRQKLKSLFYIHNRYKLRIACRKYLNVFILHGIAWLFRPVTRGGSWGSSEPPIFANPLPKIRTPLKLSNSISVIGFQSCPFLVKFLRFIIQNRPLGSSSNHSPTPPPPPNTPTAANRLNLPTNRTNTLLQQCCRRIVSNIDDILQQLTTLG